MEQSFDLSEPFRRHVSQPQEMHATPRGWRDGTIIPGGLPRAAAPVVRLFASPSRFYLVNALRNIKGRDAMVPKGIVLGVCLLGVLSQTAATLSIDQVRVFRGCRRGTLVETRLPPMRSS